MWRIILSFQFILLWSSVVLSQPVIKPGIEVLVENNFSVLSGKKVGLITNPSGVDSKLKSTVDILHEAKNVNLTALFAPEHGVRGNIEGGQEIENYVDDITGVPVYSLYGSSRKPTVEMLKNIDALVYDIQDIGCRSYTFISTMGLAMEAAAENDLEFVVLDRPNPLGGNRIEGNYVEDGFYSFISQFRIPYVYGLTPGELAILLKEEKMLEDGLQCKLTVVPLEGWERDMTFHDTGLEWVITSPHIPFGDSPFYYVATGIVGELRNTVSIGVGYTMPFHTLATRWTDSESLSRKLNSYDLPGVIFRPINYIPYYATAKGENLSGVQIHITDYNTVNLMTIQFYFLQAVNELYPDHNILEEGEGRLGAFDRALGTDVIRELFKKDQKVENIIDYLNKNVEEFRKISERYYLYN